VNYGALASIYDRIMAHVGYHQWLSLIDHVVATYGSTRQPLILEIGAGTGVLGRQCLDAGFSYVGSDLSQFMCRQAVRRNVPVMAADAKHLPLKSDARFDLVLFLYDGINYLMDGEEFHQVFSEVHAHLKTGGLFLFDITTEFNSKTNFNEYVDADDLDDSFYFRHSYFDRINNIQHNDFTIFTVAPGHGLLFEKSQEYHRQRVYPVGKIRSFVPESLFEVLSMWDNFSLKKYSARSERVHFLLRKKDAS
jgi:SAM-dependent methyltransferase